MSSEIHCLHILNHSSKTIPSAVTVNSFDTTCIIGIPHDGRWVPEQYKEHFTFDRELLVDTDLYTRDVHGANVGTHIIFELAAFFVNLARKKLPDPHDPIHMQCDPLHNKSLLGGELLNKEYTVEQTQEILKWYDQYHAILQNHIDAMKSKRGYALIFDGHSLLSRGLKNVPDTGKPRAHIIIGNLDGKSCDPKVFEHFKAILEKECAIHQLTIAYNDPYKGGYLTQKYSAQQDVHMIQIEVQKELYMQPLYEEFKQGEGSFLPKKAKIVQEILQKVYQSTAEYAQEFLTQ